MNSGAPIFYGAPSLNDLRICGPFSTPGDRIARRSLVHLRFAEGFGRDSQHDHEADDDLLQEGRHAEQIKPVAQHADDEHADDRTANSPCAARQRRAADHDRRDGVQLVADCPTTAATKSSRAARTMPDRPASTLHTM